MVFGEVGFAAISIAVVLGLPPLSVSIPLVIISSFIIMLISQKKGVSGDITIAIVSTGALSVRCNNNGTNKRF